MFQWFPLKVNGTRADSSRQKHQACTGKRQESEAESHGNEKRVNAARVQSERRQINGMYMLRYARKSMHNINVQTSQPSLPFDLNEAHRST